MDKILLKMQCNIELQFLTLIIHIELSQWKLTFDCSTSINEGQISLATCLREIWNTICDNKDIPLRVLDTIFKIVQIVYIIQTLLNKG